MSELLFNPDRGFTVVSFFLRGIWDTVREDFFHKDREWGDFGDFAGCLSDDIATFHDWERCCQKAFGEFPTKTTRLTQEELFTSLIELCAFYRYNFDFAIADVLELLHSMRAKPDKYKKEWNVWKEIIQKELVRKSKEEETWESP